MANKGVLLLLNRDNLETVIKKCNTNFQTVLTQLSQSEKIASQSQDLVAEKIIENVTESVGEAVDDLVELIQNESEIRSRRDGELENAIETVDNKLSNYEYRVGSAYLTFDSAFNPQTLYDGTWSLAGTLAIGVDTLYAWKRTA